MRNMTEAAFGIDEGHDGFQSLMHHFSGDPFKLDSDTLVHVA